VTLRELWGSQSWRAGRAWAGAAGCGDLRMARKSRRKGGLNIQMSKIAQARAEPAPQNSIRLSYEKVEFTRL